MDIEKLEKCIQENGVENIAISSNIPVFKKLGVPVRCRRLAG